MATCPANRLVASRAQEIRRLHDCCIESAAGLGQVEASRQKGVGAHGLASVAHPVASGQSPPHAVH